NTQDNAATFCGKDSLGGAVKCPINVCCSAFGFCGRYQRMSARFWHLRDHLATDVRWKVCLSNVRDRQCNRISPSQILTTGLTHLYAAFATIDANTLTIAPANPADVDL
ncbi:hypothetical protein PspLS_00171, partial [Pyricularia sp. CBS 133598]